MNNMERIAAFAKRVETSVTFGGCPVDRLFMADVLCYSDFYVVPMTDEINAIAEGAPHVYKLRVEVTMQRARRDYENKWGWRPDKYEQSMLMFYHHDFEELLAFAADYLEKHLDEKAGLYEVWSANTMRKATVVKCIKHSKIGRVIHISEDPDYDKYHF